MIAMPHQLPVFEVLLKKRGRAWKWSVCTAEGQVVMQGAESGRTFARYNANRALFLMLLCAPYSHIHPSNNDGRGPSHSGRSRTSI
jgi:hypothetical protein